jgi:hypothetical protein
MHKLFHNHRPRRRTRGHQGHDKRVRIVREDRRNEEPVHIRGDNSGTHVMEQKIWIRRRSILSARNWYNSTGQGKGASLDRRGRIAGVYPHGQGDLSCARSRGRSRYPRFGIPRTRKHLFAASDQPRKVARYQCGRRAGVHRLDEVDNALDLNECVRRRGVWGKACSSGANKSRSRKRVCFIQTPIHGKLMEDLAKNCPQCCLIKTANCCGS